MSVMDASLPEGPVSSVYAEASCTDAVAPYMNSAQPGAASMTSNPVSQDTSVAEILDAARHRYPSMPFLALGQTVFWDEPTKAVWRRLLDVHYPDARLIAGVHDTDYFAKLSTTQVQDALKFALVGHDDGATRDLWSAAGEISALFGSESVPTRHVYRSHGVPFDWLTRQQGAQPDRGHGGDSIRSGSAGDRATVASTLTSAWGWRGLVRTDGANVVAGDVPASEFADALLRLLEWGLGQSMECLPGSDHAAGVAETIQGWVVDFMAHCSEWCRLNDLYENMLPRFYELLLGEPASRLETTSSSELFLFNTQTSHLPRFRVLDLFLAPETRAAARLAYDRAVAKSGIYTLDSFGEGAIPFDLVAPGHGRGTLFLRGTQVIAQLGDARVTVSTATDVRSTESLARVVENRFGPRAAIVGKAVVFVDMLAAEHLVVFHETASGYTPITRRFNEGLAAAGMSLDLAPIVRLAYPTWDALEAARTEAPIRLPSHLAATFGRQTIAASDFGREWRHAVARQENLLREIGQVRRLRDLLDYLEAHDPTRQALRDYESLIRKSSSSLAPGQHPDSVPSRFWPDTGEAGGGAVRAEVGSGERWCELLREYEDALRTLQTNARKSLVLKSRLDEHRAELRRCRVDRASMERRKGEDWRANIQPLQVEAAAEDNSGVNETLLQLERRLAIRAEEFDRPLNDLQERIAVLRGAIDSVRRARRALERSADALSARAIIQRTSREAQSARLILIRNAFLTVEGLTHTHYRPTAWWIPMVDPSGRWFETIVAGTRCRFEHLWPES
ncbi:MAG: hypothetical protein ACLQVD_14595 [Capsulimonadaceae bacterium]